jgi:dTDP-4-dehydrorhamnose 3,5-epimerase
MKITPLTLEGLFVIEPRVFEDDRGFFFESFHQDIFEKETGTTVKFVQDNHSRSIKNVLRGMHYQAAPMGQGKLVRIISGEIVDVVVDIRPHSPTFGEHLKIVLSEQNRKQLWVPEGFAHGFLTLSDTAEMLYKTTNFFSKEHDRGIRWDDPDLKIDWPIHGKALLSDKDANATLFKAHLSSLHK